MGIVCYTCAAVMIVVVKVGITRGAVMKMMLVMLMLLHLLLMLTMILVRVRIRRQL